MISYTFTFSLPLFSISGQQGLGCCPFYGGGSVVVDLLFNALPIVCGSLCLPLFCYALLYVHSSFATILKRKRKLVALLLLSYRCSVTLQVLQHVIVVFPDQTHIQFGYFLVARQNYIWFKLYSFKLYYSNFFIFCFS